MRPRRRRFRVLFALALAAALPACATAATPPYCPADPAGSCSQDPASPVPGQRCSVSACACSGAIPDGASTPPDGGARCCCPEFLLVTP